MRTRTKLFVAIAAFVIALGAAVGVTIGVLAARQITVTTPINVGYTAHEVAAHMSATYTVGSGEAVNFETADHQTTISFDGTEADDNTHNVKAFAAPAAITLSKTDSTVTFAFTITNDLTTGSITATITMPTTQTNVTVTKTGDSNSITVAAGQTETYTVTVAITNVVNDAAFSGDFSWNLEKA